MSDWIKTSERLPENGQPVIFAVKPGPRVSGCMKGNVDAGSYYESSRESFCDERGDNEACYTPEEVLYWQPMPKHPEADKCAS